MATDCNLARQMGHAFREHAARFAWDTAAEQYLELFAQCMGHMPEHAAMPTRLSYGDVVESSHLIPSSSRDVSDQHVALSGPDRQ